MCFHVVKSFTTTFVSRSQYSHRPLLGCFDQMIPYLAINQFNMNYRRDRSAGREGSDLEEVEGWPVCEY